MLTVGEATARILAAFAPLGAETVAIDQALGRTLAKPVTARLDHPPQAVSAMDGYAVRAADVTALPVRLKVVESIAAGTLPTRALSVVSRTAEEATSPVEIEIAGARNQASFSTQVGEYRVQILTRLLEGPYPNYEQVIPKDNPRELRASRTDLMAAVDIVDGVVGVPLKLGGTLDAPVLSLTGAARPRLARSYPAKAAALCHLRFCNALRQNRPHQELARLAGDVRRPGFAYGPQGHRRSA